MNADFASSIETTKSNTTDKNDCKCSLKASASTTINIEDTINELVNEKETGRDNNNNNNNNTFLNCGGKQIKVIYNKEKNEYQNIFRQQEYQIKKQQPVKNKLIENKNIYENDNDDDDDAAAKTSANQLNEASLAFSINRKRISNSIATTTTSSAAASTTETTCLKTNSKINANINTIIAATAIEPKLPLEVKGAEATTFSLINRERIKNLKLCNNCHQEILAKNINIKQLNEYQLNQQFKKDGNLNNSKHQIITNSSSTETTTKTTTNDLLPLAQYCQKCLFNLKKINNNNINLDSNNVNTQESEGIINQQQQQQQQQEEHNKLLLQNDLIDYNQSNYSNNFWKFISNLPRSITQRRKSSASSTTSSVLNQEVIGYLKRKELEKSNFNDKKKLYNKEEKNLQDIIVIDNTLDRHFEEIDINCFSKKISINNNNFDDDDDDEEKQFNNLINKKEKEEEVGKKRKRNRVMMICSGDDNVNSFEGNTKLTLANKNKSNIVECVPLQDTTKDCYNKQSDPSTTTTTTIATVNNNNNAVVSVSGFNGNGNEIKEKPPPCAELVSVEFTKQREYILLQEQKQTNKTSIATTIDTSRSSVSSISSCILSTNNTSDNNSEIRLKWGKKMDFLLSIIGFAVDLANIWRFPYLVYKNGGGVFFIPYTLMLIFGGIPLFFLELCLGQFVKKGPITVWNKICPSMKGVGYCSILISWYVSFYYNVLIAWSVYFIYRSILSFGNKMPWEDCDNLWNSKTTCVSISQLKELCSLKKNETLGNCRKELFSNVNVTSPSAEFFVKELSQLDQSNGFDHMGYLRPELVFCLIIVYLLHYMSLFRGLETSGKVVWVTATAPYIILSILLIRGLFLPGAYMGIEYYLSPKLEKLQEPQVWIDAAQQVFYSIGVGFGVHLTYASFNSHNNNCHRDCLMTSAVNAITSAYSGLVVFVYLGYMAQNLGVEIDKVANEGYSLVFEVYPEALTTLPFARFWSILFFIMLLTLGIDSAMGGLESVITGLEDEFKFAKGLSRGQLTGLVIISSFFPALLSCTQGGAYTIFWFDIYSAGVSLLFSALFETIGVVYFYGLKKFIPNIESMLGRKPHLFYIICWKYISPLFLSGVIIMSIYTATVPVYRNYTFPLWSIILGWALAFSSVAAVPLFAIGYWISNWNKNLLNNSSGSPEKRGKKIRSSAGAAGGGGSSSLTVCSSKKSPYQRPVSVSCGNYALGGNGGIITTSTTTTILNYKQNML